ncbi:MAG: TadE/TadG family type IV pilus assembly protein [Pirellulaceae bacterium]|jgi:Flp pilus assembly protein TadG
MRNQRSIRTTNRSGTTTIEFAVAAPVVLLIIFGCIEITRMSLLLNLAQDACYDAARHAMVEGATTAEATARAQQVLAMFGTKNATIQINDGNGITSTSTHVKVNISIPMRDNAYVLKYFYTNRFINAAFSLKLERYTGYYSE